MENVHTYVLVMCLKLETTQSILSLPNTVNCAKNVWKFVPMQQSTLKVKKAQYVDIKDGKQFLILILWK